MFLLSLSKLEHSNSSLSFLLWPRNKNNRLNSKKSCEACSYCNTKKKSEDDEAPTLEETIPLSFLLWRQMITIDWTAKKAARLVPIATLQKRDDDESSTLEETIPISLSLSLSFFSLVAANDNNRLNRRKLRHLLLLRHYKRVMMMMMKAPTLV